jgi:excinuclease ABC subunit B
MGQTALSDYRVVEAQGYAGPDDGGALALAAEPVVAMMTRPELEKLIKTTEKQMEAAAKELDFLQAAKLRDELAALKTMLKGKRE